MTGKELIDDKGEGKCYICLEFLGQFNVISGFYCSHCLNVICHDHLYFRQNLPALCIRCAPHLPDSDIRLQWLDYQLTRV